MFSVTRVALDSSLGLLALGSLSAELLVTEGHAPAVENRFASVCGKGS